MAISSMPAFVKSCNIQRERDKVVIDSPWKRAQAGRVSDSAFLLPDGPMVLTYIGEGLAQAPSAGQAAICLAPSLRSALFESPSDHRMSRELSVAVAGRLSEEGMTRSLALRFALDILPLLDSGATTRRAQAGT